MTLPDFHKNFPDEESCITYFKTQRLSNDLTCKSCGSKEFSFRNSKLRFYCLSCNKSFSLKSGTVMENSNLSFMTWLFCIKYMTLTKKSISALEMQRLLGQKRYEPVWYMMHKLRIVMGKRDALYELKGNIEIDEGFFERVESSSKTDENKDNTPQKRGRGSQKQSKVLVMTESKKIENKLAKNKHKPDRCVGYIKMIVMDNLKADSINAAVNQSVDKETEVLSDGYKGYTKLKEIIATHLILVEPNKSESAKQFPWVNRVISNSKKMLLGIHHNVINQRYIQNYFNEFCYKFNRRYFGNQLHDRLVLAAITNSWD